MPKLTQNNKLKTLYLLRLLAEYSDENHPLSSTRLIELLAERGIVCERKSLYADVEALNAAGYDILSVRSPKRGFFMASRSFELPEVLLLIDAVTGAGFITPKKTEALVEKLKALASKPQAETMRSSVYVDTQSTKCDNEEIYISIDHLNDAITAERMVKFVYRRRCVDKKNGKKYTEKTMTVSPYALIWKNDHYYLICNNPKYDNLMNLRIDRMKKLTILDDAARPVCEVSDYTDAFDPVDYAAKMFNMFSGRVEDVTLRCHLDLQEEMLDRFGKNIPMRAVDMEHFETTVSAAVSDGLASWIMQYGDGVQVLSPPDLIDLIKTKSQAILNLY